MKAAKKRWQVCDKQRLPVAVMEELAGGSHISFEGNLRKLKLLTLPGATENETTVLKRNTTWPKQDFVVLPLESSGNGTILAAMGGVVPRSILHIQIEKNGVIEFGAYDQFDPGCIFFGMRLQGTFMESMISSGVIEPAT